MQVITSHYLDKEQPNTVIDLKTKIKTTPIDSLENEIIVTIDSTTFNNNDYNVIQQLPQIIKDSGEIGKFELGNLKINISKTTEYQNDLISL
jgi:hypothetical protein